MKLKKKCPSTAGGKPPHIVIRTSQRTNQNLPAKELPTSPTQKNFKYFFQRLKNKHPTQARQKKNTRQ